MSRNALIAMVLLLAACGERGGQSPAPKQTRTASAVRVDRPVEDVLARIPPQQRVAVQAALACRIKANKGPSLAITPQLIQDVAETLKTDPSSARC